MDSSNFQRRGEKRKRESLPPRKPKILYDCWLNVLKCLTCPEWSEKRYVCRQINTLIERNISCFPRGIIERAVMDEGSPKPEHPVIAYGAIVPKLETEQWLLDRGITFNSPWGLPARKALICRNYSGLGAMDMCIVGPAKQNVEVRKPWIKLSNPEKFPKSIVFFTQFCPIDNFSSWDSLEQFLTFLFDPFSYSKEVKMFAINKKIVEAVKDKLQNEITLRGNINHTQKSNSKTYIRCGTFTLQLMPDTRFDEFQKSLKWLSRNVRADSIRIPFDRFENLPLAYRLLINFVLGVSRKCARREIRAYSNFQQFNLLFNLAQKFASLPPIECEIPTVVLEHFSSSDFEAIEPNLGINLIHQEVDSQGAEFLYVLENGTNRMRISFCKNDENDDKECYVKFYASQPYF